MKGKKVISLSAALVLGLGALAGFAGCDRTVTSAETRKKVFEAIAAADLTSYEMNTEQSQKSETKEKDSYEKISANATARLSYYTDDDDKVFGDYFTQSEASSESSSPSSESLEKRNSFEMNFYRGDSGYRFSDSWKGVGLKKGDYAGMARKLKAGGEYVLTKGAYSVSDTVSDGTFASYAALMETLDGKITKTGSGYEAEVDVVNSAKFLLGKMSGLVASYEKNTAMTVREFFADEFVKKLMGLTLQDEAPSAGFGALAKMIEESTGRSLLSNSEYYPAATNGTQAFYACLESKMLFTVLSQTAPSGVNAAVISSKDGTVGGMKASVLLGSAAEVKAEIGKAAANPEKFLLEKLFGFKNGERDKGTLKMVTTVTLNGRLAVTGMTSVIERSATEYPEAEEGDGKIGGTDYSKLSATSEIKVRLQKASALTDLSGMKVDMGKRLKTGTYTLTAEDVTMRGYRNNYDSVSWTGDAVCTATVTDTGVSVAAKFASGEIVFNETRTYTYGSSSFSDYNDLFDGAYTVNGTEYNLYGLTYRFYWYSYGDTGEMSLGNYSNSIKIPTERVYITL